MGSMRAVDERSEGRTWGAQATETDTCRQTEEDTDTEQTQENN